MKAFIDKNKQFSYTDMEEQEPAKGQVKVRLHAAGLNHRDLNIPKRRSPDDHSSLILGSDGAGVVEEIGEGVSHLSPSDEVIINPALGWKENSDVPPEGFNILGMPDHGTFAEKIVISADQVEPKPDYLTFEEAAVVALAGVTGYRAMFTKGGLQSGQTVFIPGAGSGVSTLLIQFAKAAGARVITASRSETKRRKATELGADLAIDTNSDWQAKLKNEKVDLVIESIGKATFARSLDVLKKGGTMVTFGATTEDDVTFNIRKFFYGQYKLYGSTMGSREELQSMLRLIEKKQIRPVVDKVYPLPNALEAFRYLENGSQFGKIAIKIR